jgi:hypothetical protein
MSRRIVLKFAIAVWIVLAPILCTLPKAKAAEAAGRYTGNMQFDTKKVPFSRYGSYISFSHIQGSEALAEGLYLRCIHGGISSREVFRLEVLHGRNPVPFKEIATPTLLRLEAETGVVEIAFANPPVVRIRGKGAALRLTMPTPLRVFAFAPAYDTAFPVERSRWEVNSFSQQTKYMLTALQGSLVVDAPWRTAASEHIVADFLLDPATGTFEGAIEEFRNVWHPRQYEQSFDESLRAVKREYEEWLAKMPAVPEEFQPAADLAAYVNWASVVAPEGHLKRPAMLMSKISMTHIWSWDHCFNAMALAYKYPELAWDQLLVILDNQDADGAFPDFLNDRGRIWNFSKPPIHGWALRWMMERTQFIDAKKLAEVYEPLCRWTEWYFKYRDYDHDGIPQYNHGNDSGWDNATIFRLRPPVEAPDLSAYLIIQMDVLSDVARTLGKAEESQEWKRRADELLRKLLAHSWRGDRFVAPRSGDHEIMESESLILFLPLLLGDRLPAEVRSKLVAGLKEEARFLTEHGLATEPLRSPQYQPDGYWLGPIWAPSTMLIAEGLAKSGEKALARDLQQKFCRMVARSGMAENFDAVTGAGLRDPAYTWTSSVFLIFAHELLPPQPD